MPAGTTSAYTPAVRLLADRFLTLQAQYRHCKSQDTPAYRAAFVKAHIEMWILVNAIIRLTNPPLQDNIDQTRRLIMEEVHKKHFVGYSAILPYSKQRQFLWSDYDLTPELAHDPAVTGALVPRGPARDLKKLLIAQRAFLQTTLARIARG